MAVKIEKREMDPRCPHCERQLDVIVEVKRGVLTAVQVYCCPHCEKVLSVSSPAFS